MGGTRRATAIHRRRALRRRCRHHVSAIISHLATGPADRSGSETSTTRSLWTSFRPRQNLDRTTTSSVKRSEERRPRQLWLTRAMSSMVSYLAGHSMHSGLHQICSGLTLRRGRRRRLRPERHCVRLGLIHGACMLYDPHRLVVAQSCAPSAVPKVLTCQYLQACPEGYLSQTRCSVGGTYSPVPCPRGLRPIRSFTECMLKSSCTVTAPADALRIGSGVEAAAHGRSDLSDSGSLRALA